MPRYEDLLRRPRPGALWLSGNEREALADALEAARNKWLTMCTTPRHEMTDFGGHVHETRCGDCPGCVLADCLAALDELVEGEINA